MMSATARGFSVSIEPRPVRIEMPPKVVEVVKNFTQGKDVKSVRRRKQAIRLLSAGLAAVPAIMLLPIEPVSAASLGKVAVMAATSVIPPEVDKVLFQIQLVCLGLCVSAGVIMAMIAGFFRIIGLREEARKRYTDAVMGMIQVLTAPVVLGIIATIVRGLLKLFPAYAA